MMKREKGQALVEFTMVIVMFMIILLGIVVVTPLIANVYIAKQVSAKGARAGSIYYADGVRTCLQDVLDAVGDPPFIRAEWTVEVSPNCDNVPTSTIASNEPIIVIIHVEYSPLFVGGFGWPPKETADTVWPLTVTTVERTR